MVGLTAPTRSKLCGPAAIRSSGKPYSGTKRVICQVFLAVQLSPLKGTSSHASPKPLVSDKAIKASSENFYTRKPFASYPPLRPSKLVCIQKLNPQLCQISRDTFTGRQCHYYIPNVHFYYCFCIVYHVSRRAGRYARTCVCLVSVSASGAAAVN